LEQEQSIRFLRQMPEFLRIRMPEFSSLVKRPEMGRFVVSFSELNFNAEDKLHGHMPRCPHYYLKQGCSETVRKTLCGYAYAKSSCTCATECAFCGQICTLTMRVNGTAIPLAPISYHFRDCKALLVRSCCRVASS